MLPFMSTFCRLLVARILAEVDTDLSRVERVAPAAAAEPSADCMQDAVLVEIDFAFRALLGFE